MATVVESGKPRAGEDLRFTSWDGGSELSLHLALGSPATDCIEAGPIDQGAWCARHRATRRLSLTVTTQSAYRQPIAKAFAAAIQARLCCSRDLHQRIHTALQEAVTNAMLHGNLGLGSQPNESMEGFAASHAAIGALFECPAIARRAIRIDAIWNTTMLHIMVRDCGKGFAENRLELSERLQNERHHGRGLLILDAFCDRVALLDGGTTIKMAFRL
jgi:anti-sigma regulatory factor (Ser/Thr protein kinase)